MKKGLKIKKSKVDKALKALEALDQEEEDNTKNTEETKSYSPTSSRHVRGDKSSEQDSPAKGELSSRRSALEAMDDLLVPNAVVLPGSKVSKKAKEGTKPSHKGSSSKKKEAEEVEDQENKRSKKPNHAMSSAESLLRKAREASKRMDVEGEKDELDDGEMDERAKKGRGQAEPPSALKSNGRPKAHSTVVDPSTYDELKKELNSIFDDLPTNPRDTRREIDSYLNKLQNLALKKAELMLKSFALDTSPSELIKMVKELKEMQLTNRWTKKLEKAILENPSKLLPPGTRGGWTLLSKVKEMSQQLKSAKEQDNRKSGIKHGNNAVVMNNQDGPVLDLPEDESKSNAV